MSDVMSDVLLTCRDIKKTYQEGALETHVLKGVSFSIKPGELVAIVGASGSGKSTLLHILGALDTPTAGRVEFNGINIVDMKSVEQANLRNKQIGFIYQFHHLLADFTALENVAMPLLIAGMKPADAKMQALQTLKAVGIQHRAEHRPCELSGGERQRVAIARAVVNRPALVLADEPTGNLDNKTAIDIYDLIRQLNQEFNMAFLVVTHDGSLAMKMDRQLSMRDGLFAPLESGESCAP